MSEKAKSALKNIFGYDEFKSHQEVIINNILNKNDTLVIMPTGSGKSICYQIPAIIFNGLTIVISPLISLMKDQVEQLKNVGVPAAFLNSSLEFDDYKSTISKIVNNQIKLLYLAPETLLKERILSILIRANIDCFAIDEAHCISHWGHDFRPEYRKLIEARSNFPQSVCVALTATATPRVQKDIKDSLGFSKSDEFVASFNRNNLFIRIVQKKNPLSQIIQFINKYPDQSGIIYCFSRNQVDELYIYLKNNGLKVLPYHAGLTSKERVDNQELFIKDDIQIIIATIAFGMGINKPNIRFIIHYDIPKNIESYYQEIGRAGRDGLKAYCLMLFSYKDIGKIKYFINQKSDTEKKIATVQLNALLGFAETDLCRRIPMLKYFGEDYTKDNCGMCDNCIDSPKQLIDITIPAQKFLSCVKRTGEVFGAHHIIDVLRGSKVKKVLQKEHNKLSTYGIGMEYSKNQWLHLSRQFIQKGLLIQDSEHGSLKLTKKTYDVFNSLEIVMGTMEKEVEYLSKDKNEDIKKENIFNTKYDIDLFNQLKILRKQLADENSVPPYIILPDKALIEMSIYYPQSKESLLNIHGIGSQKLQKYGDILIHIIAKYCKTNSIQEKLKIVNNTKQLISKQAKNIKRKYEIIGQDYNSGKSIKGLQKEYNSKINTVLDNLYKYYNEGNSLRPDGLLEIVSINPEQLSMAIDAFKKHGAEFLKPVFNELNEKINYDELKIIRLYYLNK
jgi:ATP-dependent DNA helicase RecQ